MYKENLISKKMRVFAEKNEWLISGEYIYGEEQGHLFTGLDGKNNKTFITPVPGILEDQADKLMEMLKSNSSTMKLDEYDITDDFLCIRIKDSASLKTDDIEFILALLTGMFNDLDIVTENRCQECKELGADHEDFVYDLYCYIHEDCLAKYKGANEPVEETAEEDAITKEENEPEDSSSPVKEKLTLKNILFTLGGALLGSIPWIIMPFIMDVINDLLKKINAPDLVFNFTQSLITCICAYLVSYFAIVGYKLTKDKMSRAARWMIGIVSISVIILVQFAYLAVLIAKEPAVVLNFSNYITNLVKYNFYINMLLGAAIGIVFTLIAVLPFFESKPKSDDEKRKFIENKKALGEKNKNGVEKDEE